MSIEDYLRIPYVMLMQSVPCGDGRWIRRAEYPELDCAVEDESAVRAVARLEEARVHRIREMVAAGRPVPVPRPPLRA